MKASKIFLLAVSGFLMSSFTATAAEESMQDKERRDRSIEAMERQAAMEPSHPKIARERRKHRRSHHKAQEDQDEKKRYHKHQKKIRDILRAFALEMSKAAEDNRKDAAKAKRAAHAKSVEANAKELEARVKREEARIKEHEALTKEREALRATAVAEKVKNELQKHPEAESASAAESPVASRPASSSDANTDFFAPLSK